MQITPFNRLFYANMENGYIILKSKNMVFFRGGNDEILDNRFCGYNSRFSRFDV